MNLKVGFLILCYYAVVSIMFFFGSSAGVLTESLGYNTSIDLNASTLNPDEIDDGGLFSVGVSFSRFALWVGFGIGLPDDTPAGFQLVFIIWSTLVTLLTAMFVISSIWDG